MKIRGDSYPDAGGYRFIYAGRYRPCGGKECGTSVVKTKNVPHIRGERWGTLLSKLNERLACFAASKKQIYKANWGNKYCTGPA
jgi:hypothetical protein